MTTGITCTSCRHALNPVGHPGPHTMLVATDPVGHPGPHTMLVATDDHGLVAVAIDPDTDGMHPSHGTGSPIVVGLDAAAAVGDGPEPIDGPARYRDPARQRRRRGGGARS